MPTDKERAQAQRLAQNAENQRAQDEYGLADARRRAEVADVPDAAEETRKVHAEQLRADQERQTDNDSSTPDDSVVSDSVKGKGFDAYVADGAVSHDVSVSTEGPEDAAYDSVKEHEESGGGKVPVDDDTRETVEAETEDKKDKKPAPKKSAAKK